MNTSGSSPLEREIAYYERERDRLVAQHLGKFVVIKGEELLGAFDTPLAAYEAAVAKYGREPFLTRQVLPVDPLATAPALYTGLTSLSA